MSRNDPTRVYYMRKNPEGHYEWSLYAIVNNTGDADKLADELCEREDVLEIKITADDPRCYEDFDFGDVPEVEDYYDEDSIFDLEYASPNESDNPLFVDYLIMCGLTPDMAREMYAESKRALSA